MESDANFVPMGHRSNFPAQSLDCSYIDNRLNFGASTWKQNINLNIPENKKNIRQARTLTKKERSKINSNAKKLRKQNEKLHQRATQNVDKLIKKKNRKRQRELELGSQKNQTGATRQIENSVSLHDRTGNTLNNGEVVTLTEGKTSSKESFIRVQGKKSVRLSDVTNTAAEKLLDLKNVRDRDELHMLSERSIHSLPEPYSFAEENLGISEKLIRKQKRPVLNQSQYLPSTTVKPGRHILPVANKNQILFCNESNDEILSCLKAKIENKYATKRQRHVKKNAKKLTNAAQQRDRQFTNGGVPRDPEKVEKETLPQFRATPVTSRPESKNKIFPSHLLEHHAECLINQPDSLTSPTSPRKLIDIKLEHETQEKEKYRVKKKKSARAKKRTDRKALAALNVNSVEDYLTDGNKKKLKQETNLNIVDSGVEIIHEKLNCEDWDVKRDSKGYFENMNQEILDNVMDAVSFDLNNSSEDRKEVKRSPEEEVLDLMKELAGNIR